MRASGEGRPWKLPSPRWIDAGKSIGDCKRGRSKSKSACVTAMKTEFFPDTAHTQRIPDRDLRGHETPGEPCALEAAIDRI